ncbi:MAG: sulfate adenylyltransferase, partial [Gammaproteobacteria bacterium]|nr:sulfate adenylyltransferase [Gammaproteobacteria bacterium]
PAIERNDLVPVYSFNADGLWLAKSRTMGHKVGKASRVSLWDDLVMRIDTEMINKAK